MPSLSPLLRDRPWNYTGKRYGRLYGSVLQPSQIQQSSKQAWFNAILKNPPAATRAQFLADPDYVVTDWQAYLNRPPRRIVTRGYHTSRG